MRAIYKKKPTKFGFINDADYAVTGVVVGGIKVRCPYYDMWLSMSRRSCCPIYKKSKPTYKDVTCCEDWKVFSTFKKWVTSRLEIMGLDSPVGFCLDKDIMVHGNLVYSPETCCLVDRRTNSFLVQREVGKNAHPLGVSYCSTKRKFLSASGAGVRSKNIYMGAFDTASEAHRAWQLMKSKLALDLADIQLDPNAAIGLRRISEGIANDAEMFVETKSF